MGNKASHTYNTQHSIRKSLKKIPFRSPNEKDLVIISMITGIDKHDVKKIFDQHLEQNPDGKMDRKCFCELYHTLMQKDVEYVENLSKNVFKALSIKDIDVEQITLNEFLITFVLTSRGDLRKKLEYAFEMYDVNNESVLEVPEVKEIILGILELYHPQETQNIDEIAKECFRTLKITEVVRKNDFIDGLMSNKNLVTVLSAIE